MNGEISPLGLDGIVVVALILKPCLLSERMTLRHRSMFSHLFDKLLESLEMFIC